MAHICFICTANVCRSPMAEGVLKHRVESDGYSDISVSSMGTHGLDRMPASEFSQKVCAEHGIDISGHLSRPISGEHLQRSDLVLCMEAGHRKFLQTFFPWHRERIFLLGAWPGKETRKSIVKDPIGAPIEMFRITYDMIAKHIDRIWDHL